MGPLRGIPGEETRAKAAPLPPELSYHTPPATVTPAAGGGETKSLLVSALSSRARLDRSPLVEKPRHQESALCGREEVVSIFLQIFAPSSSVISFCLFLFGFGFCYFFIFPDAPLFEPMMFVKSK